MRAIFTSSMNSLTLFHSRTWPSRVGLVDESLGTAVLPSSAMRTAPIAPDDTQWAHGYSGCIGVLMKGVHPASATIALFPLIWPLRMAVTGRQKLYAYLASNTAINASSTAIEAAA